jgi:LacI family transcriptional regulator
MGEKEKFTIRDVAKAAGLGVGTVSRVLNGRPYVNERSRQRVLAAIEELGYRPDLVARTMRGGESKIVAFVVRDFTGAILSVLADAVQNEMDLSGFSLFVASSYHDMERELAIMQRFKAHRVDGFIVATSSETDRDYLAAMFAEKLPFVLLDRDQPAEVDAVQVDHAGGAAQAVEYLLGLGHEQIALISGEPNVYPTIERVRGYRESLLRHGIRFDPRLCKVGSFSLDFAYEQALRLLRRKRPPTAIFAGGTAMLPGVLHAVQECGLDVPGDISLIGGADSDLARYAMPPLTVVSWDYTAVGRTAARFLVERIANPHHPCQRQCFPTSLIIRGSCGPPSGA